jgi:hypothetical protein
MRDQKRKIRNLRTRDFEVTDGKELLGIRYKVQNEVHAILDVQGEFELSIHIPFFSGSVRFYLL